MKQRISVDQLNGLTNEQKTKLQEWWQPKRGDWIFSDNEEFLLYDDGEYQEYNKHIKTFDYHGGGFKPMFPLLSIGQMIDFLQDNYLIITQSVTKKVIFYEHDRVKYHEAEIELCDALWNAVKTVL